jgi:hypothetical protein
MRLIALALAVSTVAGAAAAQPAPADVPKAFSQYGQPDITPGLCKTVDASHTQCTIPQGTAGRYLVEATGTSTAQDDGAVAQIAIVVGDVGCGPGATRKGTKEAPWPAGVAKSLRFDCIVSVLTDRPLLVTAIYGDGHATKDPKGPALSLRKLPWDGVLSAIPSLPNQ